jgi:hypothetical protein
MGKPTPPTPPDPKATASAQTATNIGTAIAQSELNYVDQITPDGSLTFSQTGTYDYKDPLNGAIYKLPKRTATQTLSEQQQAIKDQSDKAEENLAGLAANQSEFLKDYLGQPVDINNEAVESRLYDLGRQRLDPMFAERQEALDARLANQGIAAGTRAYETERRALQQQENDAYNSLLLSGRGQAVQETLAERNQPINEISALLSGAQVSQPNFVSTQNTPVANVDYAGLVQDNYKSRLAAWQQQQAASQGILGGLFGLGSALIMSDKRTKENIKPVGSVMGNKVYSYNYKADPAKTPQIGVMAQEAEKKNPDAVQTIGGIKHVNYGELFGMGSAA